MRLSEHLAARSRTKKLLVMTHVVCGYPSFEDNWRELEVMAEFVAREPSLEEPEALEARLRALAEERGVPAGKVMQATRVAITGGRI